MSVPSPANEKSTMKAIGYQTPGPIDQEDALVDITVEKPTPQHRDLLVKIEAISVNPVDTKLRKNRAPAPGDWMELAMLPPGC